MTVAASSPAAALLLTALLLPLGRAGEAPSLEVTDLPELSTTGAFESHADACMAEANITHKELHEAIEKDPVNPPKLIKCIWGCMFRKMGLLVDGEMPATMPPDLSDEAVQEYDMMRTNCGDKVSAAADECEKGAALKVCADETTTAQPMAAASQSPP